MDRVLSRMLAALLCAAVLIGGCGGGGSSQVESAGAGGSTGGAAASGDAVAEGEQLYQTRGCASCHSVDGSDGIGPSLQGLYGWKVELADGTTVIADAAYIEESLADPGARVVDGYNDIMPAYEPRPGEVDALVAYLRTLTE